MCVFEVWNLFGGESESWFSYRFPLPNGPGKVKLPVGQVDLNRFFLFISYLSRSKNFRILEIGQVMILRKGKPCVVMPVTGSGKGFVPDDSKPVSGYIHAGRHASNLALQCISYFFRLMAVVQKKRCQGCLHVRLLLNMDLSSTHQQLQVLECHFMDPRRVYLHHVNKLEAWHLPHCHLSPYPAMNCMHPLFKWVTVIPLI